MNKASNYPFDTSTIPQSKRAISNTLHPIIPLPTSAISRYIHQLSLFIMEISYFQSPKGINSWKYLQSEEGLETVDNFPFSCADISIINSHNHNLDEDRPSINSRISISPIYKTMFPKDLFKSGVNLCLESMLGIKMESNIFKLCSQALKLFAPKK
ncbi:hypothetical protein O181_000101 [Austropuccinia psidii MF-1]|uniref:Uncharacterized protein n=1 Tax=Austropuccinia psidii MF-1 TaxID=1389203 RepID=A0A9Q3B899_9BASI|nr:hypothetical protein [Austropuccinia psidii MF-1]